MFVTKFGTLLKTGIIGRNTSLGDHFENFVDQKVAAGRFRNVSEEIRAGLRLLEDEEIKIATLQKAIDDGFESGFVKTSILTNILAS